ncbi:hypothetical protein ENUP19_0071G0035 [Entamoeba nuttalli]|uniref:Protein kinase domain containing protein n=2 Tax=Entamoeba nuttalli TaxID=412467 RepID=K2H231_ENTNP|nr:protein kinase domain containing protein [Entamoeba nuttalli P19]EKE41558.1 protein kinase domain containing protein [Entamoeba nuttalli P19]|eukprot:XP_008856106.1 protein kinase domain containing protein [Entamoeba nuttalli P19]
MSISEEQIKKISINQNQELEYHNFKDEKEKYTKSWVHYPSPHMDDVFKQLDPEKIKPFCKGSGKSIQEIYVIVKGISRTLLSEIKVSNVNLQYENKIIRFECLICDILEIAIKYEHKLPEITLEDFVLSDERNKVYAYGELFYFLNLYSDNIKWFFIDFDPAKTNIKPINLKNVYFNLQRMVELCNGKESNYNEIKMFLFDLRHMNSIQNILQHEYYQKIYNRKHGVRINSKDLFFISTDGKEVSFENVIDSKPVSISSKIVLESNDKSSSIQSVGRGGAAFIFKGKLKTKDNEEIDVSIKQFKTDLPNTKWVFKREKGMSFLVNDQINILPVVGYYEEKSTKKYYLIRTWADTTLENELKTPKFELQNNPEKSLSYIIDILSCAINFKNLGCFNRDYKLNNIFIKDGKALVGDLGTAIALSPTNPGVTKMYTPLMLPDKWAEAEDKTTNDIYSIGITLSNFLMSQCNTEKLRTQVIESKKKGLYSEDIFVQQLCLTVKMVQTQNGVPLDLETYINEFKETLLKMMAHKYEERATWDDVQNLLNLTIKTYESLTHKKYLPCVSKKLFTLKDVSKRILQWYSNLLSSNEDIIENKFFGYSELVSNIEQNEPNQEMFDLTLRLIEDILFAASKRSDNDLMMDCKTIFEVLKTYPFISDEQKSMVEYLSSLIN